MLFRGHSCIIRPKDNHSKDNYSYCFSGLSMMFANEVLWTDSENNENAAELNTRDFSCGEMN